MLMLYFDLLTLRLALLRKFQICCPKPAIKILTTRRDFRSIVAQTSCAVRCSGHKIGSQVFASAAELETLICEVSLYICLVVV